MFFKDAMFQCSQLEEQLASMYDALATSPEATSESAQGWTRSAAKERRRARLLHALAELSGAMDDDGPFLVQVPQELATLRKLVDRMRERVSDDSDTAAALRCLEAIETARPEDLHTSLLEIAEGEVRRLLRLIEEETRGSRRRHADGRRGRRTAARPRKVGVALPSTA